MYAIINNRGRQIKAAPGQVISIDHSAESVGSEVVFDQVLFIEREEGGFVAGAPFIADARVVGTVVAQAAGPKIRVFRKKRRKGMRRTTGHRAKLTRIKIKEIIA